MVGTRFSTNSCTKSPTCTARCSGASACTGNARGAPCSRRCAHLATPTMLRPGLNRRNLTLDARD
eukprot:9151707-Lingulodinium_polyedra.AAC.1